MSDVRARLVVLPWRALLVGVLAGFTSGLFGVGGGIVIVPALVVVAGFEQRRAHATSLAAIVVIAASGSLGYAEAGEVDWPVAAAMSAGGLLGAPLGTRWLRTLPQRRLQGAFSVLLLLTAARLLLGGGDGDGTSALTLAGVVGFVALGAAAGVLAGLMGVGGGIITVPALSILAGMSLVVAKGTSLLVIVPTALVGTLRNRRYGHVDVASAAAVAAGGVVTALAASRVSLRLDPEVSSALFSALLVVTAARLARRARTEP